MVVMLSLTSFSAVAETKLSDYPWMKKVEVGELVSFDELTDIVKDEGSRHMWYFERGVQISMSKKYYTFAKTYNQTVKDTKMDFTFRRGGLYDGVLTINVYTKDGDHYTTKVEYKRAAKYNPWKVQK